MARDGAGLAPQLTLDLAGAPEFGARDFFVGGSNEAAARLIGRWPDWPDCVLLLNGPAGSGKSHLGAIWAARARARRLRAADLEASGPAALAREPALLIEDLDALTPAGGRAFFHLLNLVRERALPTLLTAREAPERLGVEPPDLLSRLRLAPRVEIGAPDDALMRMVLGKLLTDHQIAPDPKLVAYAATRLDSSLDAARRFVEALDREALARKSRVTRRLAGQVLAAVGALVGEEEDEEEF